MTPGKPPTARGAPAASYQRREPAFALSDVERQARAERERLALLRLLLRDIRALGGVEPARNGGA
jgi:hypothetical protein